MCAKGSNSQWMQACVKEACEKTTMASCSRRFLTFVERDTAVDAMDLESRNRVLLGLAIAACSQISRAADINRLSLSRSSSSSCSLP